jgi:molecular chaperone HtpG
MKRRLAPVSGGVQLEKLLGTGRFKGAGKAVLEVNPHRDIIKALASLSGDDHSFKQHAAYLLFDEARILGGGRPENPKKV